ncbi:MAG: addiction module antitoxin RelB [Alphaproteobacteria bacterium RIFOXYD12_FULL_60_8]|nr:MAG: addiction module antitoxin RelB [Alphaproteobacteria bacterium RIFOXYD12_FULL_60_8]
MIEIFASSDFSAWFDGLKDRQARARILARIDRAALGNFGDCAPVGEGISEMRIHCGPGYRVYFTQHGKALVILLCGGDKSTQHIDIRKAKAIAQDWKGEA